MKIVFATGNRGKLGEARAILGPSYDLVIPADLGVTEEPEENGETLRDNSLIKAEFFRARTGLDCFADDTGLEVDALGGAPGVHTARYAGPGHDFDANIDKLLAELAKLPEGTPRTARFRCTVTLLTADGPKFFDGCCEGSIAYCRQGDGGFGYDPIFIPEGEGGLTLSQLGVERKNHISHRYKALTQLAEWLRENPLK